MAVTTISRERYRAFLIDESAIKRIWELISKNSKEPKVEFQLSDSSRISSDSLETLINFPNSKIRRIISIEFGCSYSSQVRITVKFRETAQIIYDISGDDKTSLHVSYELEQIIGNCTTWYSTVLGSPMIPFGASLILSMVLSQVGVSVVEKYNPTNVDRAGEISLLIAFFGLSIFLFWLIWRLVILPIYPKTIFAIGARAYERRPRNRAIAIIAGVIVALLVSVAANWIFAVLTR
jgi:hypothetical protein